MQYDIIPSTVDEYIAQINDGLTNKDRPLLNRGCPWKYRHRMYCSGCALMYSDVADHDNAYEENILNYNFLLNIEFEELLVMLAVINHVKAIYGGVIIFSQSSIKSSKVPHGGKMKLKMLQHGSLVGKSFTGYLIKYYFTLNPTKTSEISKFNLANSGEDDIFIRKTYDAYIDFYNDFCQRCCLLLDVKLNEFEEACSKWSYEIDWAQERNW